MEPVYLCIQMSAKRALVVTQIHLIRFPMHLMFLSAYTSSNGVFFFVQDVTFFLGLHFFPPKINKLSDVVNCYSCQRAIRLSDLC